MVGCRLLSGITVTMYIVYILFSRINEKIYTGHTTDLIKRVHFHNIHGRQRSTLQYRPWEVIYLEIFDNKPAAMKREWLFKSGKGRAWIWGKIRQEYYVKGFISNENGTDLK
jgi:putative endonuclease